MSSSSTADDRHSRQIHEFMQGLVRRNQGEREFHQAVEEFVETVLPFITENPRYGEAAILERMTEPDRIHIFRVSWEDDRGNVRTNRGYRVQFNNAIGPYKGGLRFDPSVNLSILKFLGFEQVFKCSLTGLPLGGAKGGADFTPAGKSEREIMRFCQAYMRELYKYIGPDVDVPAGDIGVGEREIGYMYGEYKSLTNRFAGTMTGKSLAFGGSLIRPEATGYGCVYFAQRMLATRGLGLAGKVCAVSGFGNVAQYTVEKIVQEGGKVVTLSDPHGFVHVPGGVPLEHLPYIKDLRCRLGRIEEYACEFKCAYFPGRKAWSVPCDIAFPCATQNEIDESDAAGLLRNGCMAVVEGANMPTTIEGSRLFRNAGILYAPAKAANAGGVATSGLEMSQNSMHLTWTREEVDERLREIMASIHDRCLEYGSTPEGVDYVLGANIAGFVKVADAMLAFGVV